MLCSMFESLTVQLPKKQEHMMDRIMFRCDSMLQRISLQESPKKKEMMTIHDVEQILGSCVLLTNKRVTQFDALLLADLNEMLIKVEAIEENKRLMKKMSEDLKKKLSNKYKVMTRMRTKLLQLNYDESWFNVESPPKENNRCVFCQGEDHLSEKCSFFNLRRRINFLFSRNLCFQCLKPRSPIHSCDVACCDVCFCSNHHAAICRRSFSISRDRSSKNDGPPPSKRIKSYFSEPDISRPFVPMDSFVINHPKLMTTSLQLSYPYDKFERTYVPSITVQVNTDVRETIARAFINRISSSASFVSRELVNKLGITPTAIRPITVNDPFGPKMSVNSYVILELSSLYKSYRYQRVFYVIEMGTLKIHLPSPDIVKSTNKRGTPLSNALYMDAPWTVDLIIGADQCGLIGADFDHEEYVIYLDSPWNDLMADYTHFGYMLVGSEPLDKPF